MQDQNPIPSDHPILIFDSGIGGLSVLAATRALMPHAPIVYAADYAAMPYGEKDEIEIAGRVPAILGRLAERYHPRVICIACNTASTIALPAVRAALELPIVGTVPAIKPAGALSKSRVIGLLGTAATIRQPYVDNLAAEFASDATIIRHGAGELVLAAEAKLRGETPDPAVFDRAIAGLTQQPGGMDIDVIVLACTHFPLVRDELAAAAARAGMRPDLHLIDGAEGIARRIQYRCGADCEEAHEGPAAHAAGNERTGDIFVTSGDVADMAPYRAALARFGLTDIKSL